MEAQSGKPTESHCCLTGGHTQRAPLGDGEGDGSGGRCGVVSYSRSAVARARRVGGWLGGGVTGSVVAHGRTRTTGEAAAARDLRQTAVVP